MPQKQTKDPFAQQMGKRVRAAMKSIGMKDQGLAEALGVDVQTLGGALRGYHRIQYEVLLELPSLLYRSLYYFVGLPDPSGLADEEQQLLGMYRAYRTKPMRDLLREDGRRYLRLEDDLLPSADAPRSL